MTDALLLVGRLVMAVCLFPHAFTRLSNISGFSLHLSMKGVPYSSGVATAVVVAEMFGPLALFLGLAPRVAAAVLVGATVITTAALHRFWEIEGITRHAEQAIFFGNLSLVAGLLIYSVSGPGAWSWQAFWSERAERLKAAKKGGRSRRPKTSAAHFREGMAEVA
jgi:uncharacterized membrane protein YphA (DoxX/SURF4 family)